MPLPALLALANGTIFEGLAVGATGEAVGEVVFNTSMTGYQEILTDPSYASQLVTLTYPHIGNTGCNDADVESARVQAAGLIVRDLSRWSSNWRAQEDLGGYLERQNVVAIGDIDTRALTRILREQGAQSGCIIAADKPDADQALLRARAFPGLAGLDLARVVTTAKPYAWSEGSYDLGLGGYRAGGRGYRVVAYDFGVKRNLLRLLADRGCEIEVVPATTPVAEVLTRKPDGVFLSNGPGDPQPCGYAVDTIRELLKIHIPMFGICLGHQLLALATGAHTMKMKFGHHGANHPVQELASGRVLISSQNHGFAVDEASLPDNVRVTHRSLFDGSNQGIELTDAPAFSFQGHPEASPGPHDILHLFDRFITAMEDRRHA